MGDMMDYAKSIEDLFELLSHEDEICKVYMNSDIFSHFILFANDKGGVI